MEVPLGLDLDFKFDFENQSIYESIGSQTDNEGLQLQSPRSPTSMEEPPLSPSPPSPFDPSRFFQFPLDPPSNESSPVTLLSPPAATSCFGWSRNDESSKENYNPIPPPPQQPLSWIWVCHLCHSRYPLGATRRCLVDGHWYCSGVRGGTTQRNVTKKKRSQACSSEFDYVRWQDWLYWRQKALAQKQNSLPGAGTDRAAPVLRGCEGCEYPSQCRYEKLNQIPDVVPTTSKKVRARKEDSVPAGASNTAERTAHETECENQNQNPNANENENAILAYAREDTNEQEQKSSLPSTCVADHKARATIGGESQCDKQQSGEAAANANLQFTNLHQLRRTKSRSGEHPRDNFRLKQSQIVDFFRVTKKL